MFFSGFKRYRYAINALNAKATFSSLSFEDQEYIWQHAVMLYATEGRSGVARSSQDLLHAERALERFQELSEFEQYSLLSMAMELSGVPPLLIQPWDCPKNPFSIAVNNEDWESASRFIYEKTGVRV